MNNPLDPPPGNFQIPLVDDTETSNASVHPSNKDDLSARDVTLYGVLGVLFGSLLSGGFAYYDTHPMFGVILALIGAIGLAVMAILLIRYRLKIIHAFITAIAALVATWVVLGYVLWTKPKEVVVHDRPTVEDVAKATESITAERDTEKQRAESATQQLAKYQTLYPALQSNLAAATTERDALRKTQDGLTQELNSIRAQLGPKSTILGLDNAKRWELYTAIEDASTYDKQGDKLACRAMESIVNQNDLSMTLFDEFNPVLRRSWHILPQGAPPPLHQPFGITFLVSGHSGVSFTCASHIVDVLRNMLQAPVSFRADEVSDNLAKCNNECVEIRYGSER